MDTMTRYNPGKGRPSFSTNPSTSRSSKEHSLESSSYSSSISSLSVNESDSFRKKRSQKKRGISANYRGLERSLGRNDRSDSDTVSSMSEISEQSAGRDAEKAREDGKRRFKQHQVNHTNDDRAPQEDSARDGVLGQPYYSQDTRSSSYEKDQRSTSGMQQSSSSDKRHSLSESLGQPPIKKRKVCLGPTLQETQNTGMVMGPTYSSQDFAELATKREYNRNNAARANKRFESKLQVLEAKESAYRADVKALEESNAQLERQLADLRKESTLLSRSFQSASESLKTSSHFPTVGIAPANAPVITPEAQNLQDQCAAPIDIFSATLAVALAAPPPAHHPETLSTPDPLRAALPALLHSRQTPSTLFDYMNDLVNATPFVVLQHTNIHNRKAPTTTQTIPEEPQDHSKATAGNNSQGLGQILHSILTCQEARKVLKEAVVQDPAMLAALLQTVADATNITSS